MKTHDAIKYLRERAKKRKFAQKLDLIISLKNIDLKKPDNKFSKEVILPHGCGKKISIGIISDSLPNATGKKDLESMNKKKLKEFAKKHDFYICEAPLMPLVGKVLGRYLAPKGRMPKILPPGGNPEEMIKELQTSVRIRVKDAYEIQTIIGSENMDDTSIAENVETLIDELKKTLPNGKDQMKNVYLKFTMSAPVKIDF